MSAGTLKVAIQQASRFSRLEDWELRMLLQFRGGTQLTERQMNLHREILQELRDRHA